MRMAAEGVEQPAFAVYKLKIRSKTYLRERFTHKTLLHLVCEVLLLKHSPP